MDADVLEQVRLHRTCSSLARSRAQCIESKQGGACSEPLLNRSHRRWAIQAAPPTHPFKRPSPPRRRGPVTNAPHVTPKSLDSRLRGNDGDPCCWSCVLGALLLRAVWLMGRAAALGGAGRAALAWLWAVDRTALGEGGPRRRSGCWWACGRTGRGSLRRMR
jgi:hypothetical protein